MRDAFGVEVVAKSRRSSDAAQGAAGAGSVGLGAVAVRQARVANIQRELSNRESVTADTSLRQAQGRLQAHLSHGKGAGGIAYNHQASAQETKNRLDHGIKANTAGRTAAKASWKAAGRSKGAAAGAAALAGGAVVAHRRAGRSPAKAYSYR